MGTMNPDHDDGHEYLAAFRAERPGSGTRRRNWQVLQGRLKGVEPGDDEPVLPGTSDRRRLALSVGLAVAIAAAVLLMIRGIGSGLIAAREHRAPGMEAIDQAPSASPRLAIPARPTSVGSTIDENPMTEQKRSEPASRVPPRAAPAATQPLPTPMGSADDLAAESRLLAEARRALSEGDLDAAIEALGHHAQRFPKGALREERLAYEAIARCRKEPSAQTASRFFALYASSPHGNRVRAACGLTSPEPVAP